MAQATCPSCGEDINISSKPKMGQKVICPECGNELEIVWLDPIELDWPYDEDDYDDDDMDD